MTNRDVEGIRAVADCLSRAVAGMPVDGRIAEAADLMATRNLDHLLIFDHDRLVGVLCSCDLQDAPPEAPVGRYMSSPPLCVLPTTPVGDAALLLKEARIGCLPVVAHGDVIGIVTRGDLRRAGAIAGEPRRCVACGARAHLRPDPRGTDLEYCLDCLVVSQAIDDYVDLGGGD